MLDRVALLNRVAAAMQAKSYLEIGVREGRTFHRVAMPRKFAVDPQFRIERGDFWRAVWRDYRNLWNRYFEITSDAFFAQHTEVLGKRGLDLAFIDGLHSFEQTLKDVRNCLRVLNPQGVIVLHDCNPQSAAAAHPGTCPAAVAGLGLPDWRGLWNGDVWKTIPALRCDRDLQAFVLDADQGLGVVVRGEGNPVVFDVDDVMHMDYSVLEQRRSELLNLKPPQYLDTFIRELLHRNRVEGL